MSLKSTIKKFPGAMRLLTLRSRLLQAPLHTRLPLPVPHSIHIDITNRCNLRCRFCPTGDPALLASVNRTSGYMEIGLFRKICSDLTTMTARHGRKLEILHLYKDGEPFLHRDFITMIGIARQSNAAHVVATTTNGILVDPSLTHSLLESGLDRIRFSLKPPEYYASVAQFETVLENIRFLYREKARLRSALIIQIQMIPELMPRHTGSHPLIPALKSMCDELSCDNLMGWSLSNKKDFTMGRKPRRSMDGGTMLHEVLVCPEPFSKLAINWNGGVSVCCVDWSWGTVIGNAASASMDQIWDGEELRDFRILHLQGMRCSIGPCGNCQYVLGTAKGWMLDGRREELIHSFTKG